MGVAAPGRGTPNPRLASLSEHKNNCQAPRVPCIRASRGYSSDPQHHTYRTTLANVIYAKKNRDRNCKAHDKQNPLCASCTENAVLILPIAQ